MKFKPILISIPLILLGSCTEPDPTIPSIDDSVSSLYDEESLISIAELKNNYLSGSHPIIADYIIEGRVSANDLYGEFTRALIIEDETAGIELRIDSYDLVTDFPIGSLVRVVCDDLWLASSGGTIIIGAEPTSDDYVVDYISDNLLSRSILLADSSIIEIIGEEVTISDIDHNMVSRRVQLNNLTFAKSDYTTFLYRDTETGRFVNTTHTLYDNDGNSISLSVAYSVVYGEMVLPTSPIDLEAIVEYYSGEFSLRITGFMIKW